MSPTQAYLRALAKLDGKPEETKDLSGQGTVCINCGKAFVSNPAVVASVICGLCKARKKQFEAMLQCLRP